MTHTKKASGYIAIFVVLSMLIGSMTVFADTAMTDIPLVKNQTFIDVPATHWAYESIEELIQRGAITGYPDGKFRPDLTVTRAEFAKIMVKAADLILKTASSSSFADIKVTDWYSPYVEAAKSYMTGYKDQTGRTVFKPNSAALREDIVVAIVKLKGYNVNFADVGMLEVMYKDYNSISASARSYAAIAVEKGLISGFPDETFRAQSTITRAEVAAILWRAFQYGNDDKITDGDTQDPTTTDNEPPTETEDGANTPEQNDSVKFGVDTLLSNVQRPDYMITDNDGVVYFLVNNQVKKIVDGKAVLIADGNKDFKQEIEIGNIASEIDRTYDGSNKPDVNKYLEDTDTESYEKYYIKGLLLDDRTNTVYALGSYDDRGVYIGYDRIDLISVFDLNNKETPIANYFYTFYSIFKNVGAGGSYGGFCLINNMVINNTFLFTRLGNIYRFDLINQNITLYTNPPYSFVIRDFGYGTSSFINSQYVYADTGLNIYKYDMVKGIFKGKSYDTNNTIGPIDTITSANNLFYVIVGVDVYTVDVNGKINEYILGKDLIIQDGIPIGKASAIVVDTNGNVIFYDEMNRSIRKITYK